jgi:hypothetical protein
MVEELVAMVGWSVVYRVHNFVVIDLASTLSNVREVLADLHMCRHGSDSEKRTGSSEVTTAAAAPNSLV